jgi:hypothetical protein
MPDALHSPRVLLFFRYVYGRLKSLGASIAAVNRVLFLMRGHLLLGFRQGGCEGGRKTRKTISLQ